MSFWPRANPRPQRHGRGYSCCFASVPWMRIGWLLYMLWGCLRCSGTWWPPLVPAEQFPYVFKDIKYDDSCRIKTAGIPDGTNTWKMFMVSDLQKHSFQRTISTSILRAYQKWLNGIHQSCLKLFVPWQLDSQSSWRLNMRNWKGHLRSAHPVA